MNIGASTSNFYPLPPEESLDILLQAGFQTVEIFFNTLSELELPFVRELRRRIEAAGATVAAIHPFSSFMEPYFLFGTYERRLNDGFALYQRTFEAAAEIGAPYVVIHGDRPEGSLPPEQSVERFGKLCDIGASFSVYPAQENVVKFRSQDLGYLRLMREMLGEKARFVLDIKQAFRCGLSAESVMEAMGDRIVHVHISDHTETLDCLPPGQGNVDYVNLLRGLQHRGYKGTLMLELYRHNFKDVHDLQSGARLLEGLLPKKP